MEGPESKSLKRMIDILSRHEDLNIVFKPVNPKIGEAIMIRFYDRDLMKGVEHIISSNLDINLYTDIDEIFCAIMDNMEKMLYE